ncbi:MAG: hypothetical protein A2512_06405 [Deltaproteobacteria bacterium RIFOXYD12_FULL_56_24]|nr:MAG: hypothetical protein A2512_06405 [Deltaproteobacteria bacterium RIFOXYD12_FULL_56_24]
MKNTSPKRAVLALVALGLFYPVQTQARNASDIFEAVSPSLVVVKAFDAKGSNLTQGSGIALSLDEIITNCHVLGDGQSYQIVYRDQTYSANLKYSDWERDVCALSANGLKAKPVVLGGTNKLKVGQRVYVVGAPRGLELTLSDGLISNLRSVEGGQYLQITAPISPGSSGGGLFDDHARLIGLPTFYLTDGQQLNFALPVEWISELPKRHQVAKTLQPITARINKAVALEEKGDWPGLREHALHWTQATPNNAVAWSILGIAYSKLHQTPKEIEAYLHATQLSPDYAGAWYNLGGAYGKAEQIAQEIDAYQQAIRINPEYTEVWNNLGNAYGKAGDLTKAGEAYQQAIRINPEYAGAWYNLGNTYSKAGQTGKVIEVYKTLKTIDPAMAEVFFNKTVLP